MESSFADHHFINLSIGFYRLLIKAYPTGFRREYAPDMLQVFGDSCRFTWRKQGYPGMLSLWMRTMLDYARSVVEENLHRGTDMSKEKFIKVSGYAWMVAGALFILQISLLTFGGSSWSDYLRIVFGINRAAEIGGNIAIGFANLLVLVGLVGLLVGYAAAAGSVAKAALWASILGGIASTIGVIGLTLEMENTWFVYVLGTLLLFSGLLIFGVFALRRHVLPRWSYTALLAGIWFPLLWVYSNLVAYEVLEPQAEIAFMLAFSLTGLGCFLLGLAMQAQQPAPVLAA